MSILGACTAATSEECALLHCSAPSVMQVWLWLGTSAGAAFGAGGAPGFGIGAGRLACRLADLTGDRRRTMRYWGAGLWYAALLSVRLHV